jgi:hypothetical protein
MRPPANRNTHLSQCSIPEGLGEADAESKRVPEEGRERHGAFQSGRLLPAARNGSTGKEGCRMLVAEAGHISQNPILAAMPTITVVHNWVEELKRIVPMK